MKKTSIKLMLVLLSLVLLSGLILTSCKPSGGNGGGTSLDLTGVKTQVEADKAIETYLLSTGLTRDSSAFSQQSMQLRNENNISSLPIR